MQIKVEERSKQIELQEQEITRRERELEATVRKPADAERFRLEKLAEANRWGISHCGANRLMGCIYRISDLTV